MDNLLSQGWSSCKTCWILINIVVIVEVWDCVAPHIGSEDCLPCWVHSTLGSSQRRVLLGKSLCQDFSILVCLVDSMFKLSELGLTEDYSTKPSRKLLRIPKRVASSSTSSNNFSVKIFSLVVGNLSQEDRVIHKHKVGFHEYSLSAYCDLFMDKGKEICLDCPASWEAWRHLVS